MELNTEMKPWMIPVAKAGLIAKGSVYVVLGLLGFMAAFEIAGQSGEGANRSGVFEKPGRRDSGKARTSITWATPARLSTARKSSWVAPS